MDNVTLSAKIIYVIKEQFEVDPEVFEVAMYAMSTLAVNDAVLKGVMSKSREVRGIPPESYHLMKRFDNGLTVNKFWLENYGPLKMQLALDDIKLNTLGSYLGFAESSNNDKDAQLNSLKQAKAVLMSRFDVLTMIMFLWKGVESAEKFDSFIRIMIQLSPEHEKYFKDRGA